MSRRRYTDPAKAERIARNRAESEPTPEQAAGIACRRQWTIAGYMRGGRHRYLTDAAWVAALPRTTYRFRGLGSLQGKELTLTFKRPLGGLMPGKVTGDAW
jgi:hypothetical protein